MQDNDILLRVQVLLDKANREGIEISPSVLSEFSQSCSDSFARQFAGPNKKFTLRMSNVGRPLCQLQMEAKGEKAEAEGYNHRMKMLIGDLVEAAAIAILRTAGVNIQEHHKKVALEVGGISLEGTLDVIIDGTVYDIKSASDYAFSNKFSMGYDALASNDDFGYVAQGFGYSEAGGKPFGGWIAINKETGEYAVTLAPERGSAAYEAARQAALKTITNNVVAIKQNAEFVRQYEDVAEKFYGKETGSKVLGFTCSWCNYKTSCWPDAIYKRVPQSKAKNSPMRWYTEIKETTEE